jgi:NTE family protein
MSDVTAHALDTYEPAPKSRRRGIGLCLSGGGFRASLFHLGALRRLNELGVLGKLRTVSSVSGGSIIAAHLATRVQWPINGVIPDFEERIARPFREFTSRDMRTKPILKGLLPFVTAVDSLVDMYEKHLTPLRLNQLPVSPRFVLCSTDMSYGCNWIFDRDQMGDYQVGYVRPVPDSWSLARAVAASSCFPPVFNPLDPDIPPEAFKGGRAAPGEQRDACIRKLRLTDGGNYDNMGLEPVWKDHEVVLVSDGGAAFDFSGDSNFVQRLLRYTAIVDRQAHALRKRWLISSFISGAMNGAYWGISSSTESYGLAAGYSAEIAEDLIGEMRTDLDAFSEGEAAVLENHGYVLADAAMKKHASEVITPDTPLQPPHPAWLDENKTRAALAKSDRRAWLGRG